MDRSRLADSASANPGARRAAAKGLVSVAAPRANPLPAEWTTARLSIRSSTVEEAPRLCAIFNASSHLEACDPLFRPESEQSLRDLVTLSETEAETGDFVMQSIRQCEGGAPIGYLHLSCNVPLPGTVWFSMLVLDPAHQRRGYGCELLSMLAADLARDGACRALRVRVYLGNRGALRFWSASGFDRIVRYEGDGAYAADAVASLILERPLDR